ncbi:MAG: M28 family peptidase [Bacteroidales bacterium]|nr:M28 family peptidase [Bacteroidales bacterium]
MKKFKFILILLSVQLIGLSQDLDYAKKVIQKLSSVDFKGRGYVENGDKISADYISAEFQNLGLIPITRKSYFQKFDISVNTFPNRVSVRIDGNDLVAGSDYIIESSSPSISGKFQIIKTSRSQLDNDSKLVSLVNKAGNSIILIDSRDRKNENPEATKKIDEYINFLKYSPQANIKGLIIYTSDKLTWEAAPEQGLRPIITLIKDLDINSLNSIELVVDAKFIPKYETQNVAGSIKGTTDSDSMIVVMAHYDHLGKMGKDTYFPGANDNASGVAMILNLAKHYSENKPEYTMVFIALSAEELGILGAKAFTDNPPIDLKKIKFLVNFDLAGTGEEGVKVVNGSVFKDKFDLLTKINKEQGLLPKIDIRGAACNSDHCLFYQKGVPCFYIYTLGGIQAYHDILDKSETLPLTEFVDYCKLMIEFFNKI